MNNPLVSIIIPTYNSSRTLEQCLVSIKNQSYNNIEIVVVDNNSSDNTKDIAKKYTSKVYNIWPERTAQKNYGIEKASGEYVCFIDSDMYLDIHLVKEAVAVCKNDDKKWWVCLPVKDIWSSWRVQVISFERSLYKWKWVIEAARFIKKVLVEEVWWFEEDIIFYEEFLLPQKIEENWYNMKHVLDNYVTHDFYDFTLWLYLKKKFYYGKTLASYVEKSPLSWKQLSIIWRYKMFLTHRTFYTRMDLWAWLLVLKTLEFLFWWLGYILHNKK
jgi:glycosyltransferase involved in cell wall biosynthesis